MQELLDFNITIVLTKNVPFMDVLMGKGIHEVQILLFFRVDILFFYQLRKI